MTFPWALFPTNLGPLRNFRVLFTPEAQIRPAYKTKKKPAIKQRLRNLEKKREKGEEADRDKRNHLISCGSTR